MSVSFSCLYVTCENKLSRYALSSALNGGLGGTTGPGAVGFEFPFGSKSFRFVIHSPFDQPPWSCLYQPFLYSVAITFVPFGNLAIIE